MDPEKAALAAHYEQRPQSTPRPKTTKTGRLALYAASAYCIYTIATVGIPTMIDCFKKHKKHHSDPALQCPQVGPLFPANQTDALKYMDTVFDEAAFHDLSVERLSGAVKIPSISYDDLGPIGEDKRWDVMFDFAEYLKATYPRLHEDLKLETVNTHGLLYTWEGSDSSLKPTLLMAHQDVVPVPDATVDSWTHPPFSGHFDGKYVWGRGSSDCKNQLTAIMASVEALIVAGFKPTRTVLLSFGFDEEVSGPQGAGHLAPFITERYGKDSVAVIVDEGSTFSSVWGQVFALPGVGEVCTNIHA
jgi:Gly-Xaa carboxypeptidase